MSAELRHATRLLDALVAPLKDAGGYVAATVRETALHQAAAGTFALGIGLAKALHDGVSWSDFAGLASDIVRYPSLRKHYGDILKGNAKSLSIGVAQHMMFTMAGDIAF